MRWSSASGFWVGWAFRPAPSLSRSDAGADRKQPVRADLEIVVACLERIVVEGVALSLRVAARPDQRLVRVLEAAAAKIRHRVGLPPDDVVEDPEAEVLEHGADAEDVVVGADDPKRAVRLEHPATGEQPGAGEIVIGGEAREFVPVRRRPRRPRTGRDASASLRAGGCRAGRRRRDRRRPAGSRSSAVTQSPAKNRVEPVPTRRSDTQAPHAPPIRNVNNRGRSCGG